MIADIARLLGYAIISFLDDNAKCGPSGYPLVGKVSDYTTFLDGWDFFVAIGNCVLRKELQQMLIQNGAKVVTLVHPNAVIGSLVEIGAGTVIMAGAVVNTGAKLAEGVILNTCSSVDHDCVVGSFSHIAVGAHLCGTVCIGECTWIGAGVTVINNITVCDNSLIGAGAVVVKSIENSGTYVGVPARKKF